METRESICVGRVYEIPNRDFLGAVIDFSITPEGVKFIAVTEQRGVVICKETPDGWETKEYDVKKTAKYIRGLK